MADPTITASDDLNAWAESGIIELRDDAQPWVDSGVIFEYGDPVWFDSLLLGRGILLSDSTLNNWLDASTRINGYEKILTDATLNNWADAIARIYGLSRDLGDDLNSFNESIILGPGLALSEDMLRLVDDFVEFIQEGASKTLAVGDNLNNFVDGDLLNLGYGLTFPDDLNNWLDAISTFVDAILLTITAVDDLNLWADALTSQYVGVLDLTQIDDLNSLLDSISFIYGHNLDLTEDINNWLDRLENITDLLLVDDLNSWDESVSNEIGYLVPLTDDLNSWLDALLLIEGYEVAVNEDLNSWLDEYTQVVVGLVIDLTLDVSDDFISLLADSATLFNAIHQTITASDDINNWLDALVLGYGLDLSDNLGLDWLDDLRANFELNLSDDLNSLVESAFIVLGYEFALADDLNVWLDAFATSLTTALIELVFNEDLNNWLDVFTVSNDYKLIFNETINFWLDELNLGIIYATDSLNFWNDSIAFRFNYGLELSDSINFFADDIFAFNFEASDVLDTFISNYYRRYINDVGSVDLSADILGIIPLQIFEDYNNWQDSGFAGFGIDPNYIFEFTENLDSWLNELKLGYGFLIEDDLNNWLDAISAELINLNNGILGDSSLGGFILGGN